MHDVQLMVMGVQLSFNESSIHTRRLSLGYCSIKWNKLSLSSLNQHQLNKTACKKDYNDSTEEQKDIVKLLNILLGNFIEDKNEIIPQTAFFLNWVFYWSKFA